VETLRSTDVLCETFPRVIQDEGFYCNFVICFFSYPVVLGYVIIKL